MKKILFACSFCFLLATQAQEYDFVSDSLELITRQELFQKGVPSSMQTVYYEDGTKTTFEEVLPLLSKGELLPNMFVDGDGNYHTLVVVKPIPVTFDALEENTRYPFIPENLRLLPLEELYKKPPPKNLDLVFYEDGTPTTMEDVIPLISKGELTPRMYVDADLNYRALVVVK